MLVNEVFPIAEELELDSINETFSEEMILAALASRINELLEAGRLEFLLNLLYRHDVNEQLILKALNPATEELPNIAIARILLDRLKQKIETRKKYKTPPVKDWLNFDE
jgi:hypothetical protein